MYKFIELGYNVPAKESKNLKLQLCRQHVPLEALYLGCWLVDSASKGKCCLHSCNFRLFVMSSSL